MNRFMEKVDQHEDGCWLWTAGSNGNGYGVFHVGVVEGSKVRSYAHRWSYEQHVGPIPDGLDIDHLCRVRECVNPDHLEPVTRRTNLRRSPLVGRSSHPKDECLRGHELAGENLYVSPQGVRRCRTCDRAREQARVR